MSNWDLSTEIKNAINFNDVIDSPAIISSPVWEQTALQWDLALEQEDPSTLYGEDWNTRSSWISVRYRVTGNKFDLSKYFRTIGQVHLQTRSLVLRLKPADF